MYYVPINIRVCTVRGVLWTSDATAFLIAKVAQVQDGVTAYESAHQYIATYGTSNNDTRVNEVCALVREKSIHKLKISTEFVALKSHSAAGRFILPKNVLNTEHARHSMNIYIIYTCLLYNILFGQLLVSITSLRNQH